jgi:cysteinyl-tRNA synthetase
MTLHLYDTGTRSTRAFVPRQQGTASIYLCGATVQSAPHIGHIRSGVSFDVLRRWLTYRGYEVVFVRNVTDVEDKVIAKAAEEGVPSWQVAYRNERLFSEAYDALGCLPPTIEPRATGHIPEINNLIQRLIDRGHAYAVAGDVYFDISSWPQYGRLSGQRPDAMLPAADTETEDRKRDPRDFALWKAAKPGEPTWDSPWGRGRPGWHIECSAMSERYLGPDFDIHGGGLDLEFPHHENEIAQSEEAGYGFAAYWLHNAWVVDAAGEKMSKSLGNSMLVSEAVRSVRPVELRYYLVAPHYRSMIKASDEGMEVAGTAYRRLESFVERATELVGAVDPAEAVLCADFVTAMDDDLSVPRALAAVHDVVREGNKALGQQDKETVRGSLVAARAMLSVLGLDPLDPQWQTGNSSDDLTGVVDALVALALDQRQAARARKDYPAADAIRDQLAASGVSVEDTPAGPRWTLRGNA